MRRGSRGRFSGLLLVALERLAADFHAASEYRAILDDDSRGTDVALYASCGTEHDAVAPAQVSFDVSAHDDFARFDVCLDVAVWPDGDASFAHVHRAN